jgi:hypothetical protein
MFWHDNFFTLPNGKRKPFLRLGKFKEQFIILHPYFHFGSNLPSFRTREEANDTQVYLQQFEVSIKDRPFDLTEFVFDVERNCHLEPDYVFWYETGFWTIAFDKNSYMGMGLSRLKKKLERANGAEFAICLSNNISVTTISHRIGENNKIFLNICASNDLIPFVEVMEPFRKTIGTYDCVKCLRNEIVLERCLRRVWTSNRRIEVNPIAFVMSREQPDYRMLPIIKNPFRKVKDAAICNLLHVMGTTTGGFIDSDYYGGMQFLPYAIIWDFGEVAILDFRFEQL